jgi:hypothetical protein
MKPIRTNDLTKGIAEARHSGGPFFAKKANFLLKSVKFRKQ